MKQYDDKIVIKMAKKLKRYSLIELNKMTKPQLIMFINNRYDIILQKEQTIEEEYKQIREYIPTPYVLEENKKYGILKNILKKSMGNSKFTSLMMGVAKQYKKEVEQ